MVSPSPIVRPVIGDWPVDGLLDDLPVRPPPATEKLRKIVDFYLHSMVFHKDRLGRPVRARVAEYGGSIYRRTATPRVRSMLRAMQHTDARIETAAYPQSWEAICYVPTRAECRCVLPDPPPHPCC